LSLQKIVIGISFFWLLSEVILAIVRRDKSVKSDNLDKSTLIFLWLTIIIAIFFGVYLGSKGIGLITVCGYWISIAGIIFIILGLVIRWVAILSLRGYFTVNISIQESHRIIDTGLYGHIRHPAYAGSLLSFLGLGLSFSNWLSALIIFVPITAAFIYRIHHEEKALLKTFGDKYISYVKHTRRLFPGVY
jgi:protein-S-isoprenylcysteine O-methyltransferase Ste14